MLSRWGANSHIQQAPVVNGKAIDRQFSGRQVASGRGEAIPRQNGFNVVDAEAHTYLPATCRSTAWFMNQRWERLSRDTRPPWWPACFELIM
jgi:hypothetical protein